MTQVNLTSLAHTMSYLSDRTISDMVADELFGHLSTATSLIAAKLKTSFSTTTRHKVFAIQPTFVDTPGAFGSPFTQPYRPRFRLNLTGPADGLIVRYRGSVILDADFLWDDVTPLILNQDYLFDAVSGEVQLLFAPAAMLHGLRVSYSEGYATTPETLYGAARTSHLHQMGAETELQPLSALFGGIAHKEASKAATAAATQPELASIAVVTPLAIAAHRVRIYAPQDAALVDVDQEITLTLIGGVDTQLDQLVIRSPMAGQTYELSADPLTAYSQYAVKVTGTLDANVSVSFMDFDFVDTDVMHMRHAAPSLLSDACALLAVHLYNKTTRDGLGKNSDSKSRPYAALVMPPEVAAMLSGYSHQRVNFV
jgi:hypothetical protein